MREKHSVDAGPFFPLLITVIFNSFSSSGKKKETRDRELPFEAPSSSFGVASAFLAAASACCRLLHISLASSFIRERHRCRMVQPTRLRSAWVQVVGEHNAHGYCKASPSDCREPLLVTQTSCLWQDKLFTFCFMQCLQEDGKQRNGEYQLKKNIATMFTD